MKAIPNLSLWTEFFFCCFAGVVVVTEERKIQFQDQLCSEFWKQRKKIPENTWKDLKIEEPNTKPHLNLVCNIIFPHAPKEIDTMQLR